MPQIITEKYGDGSSEKQLKKTVLHYTNGGCLAKEDIYDANDRYCFSKTAQYDLAGRVKAETNPIGQTAVHGYDAVGNRIYYKDFGGRKEILMDYDCSNRLTAIEEIGDDQLLHKTTHRYDTKHNKVATKDLRGNQTTFIPDPLGQVIQIHHPKIISSSGTLISPTEKRVYDSAGQLVNAIDARGYETHKKFNARNQVIRIEHPDGGSESFVYHLDGTLATHTNQEQATVTYSYDFLGRKILETNALGFATVYTYSAFNLIAIEDAEGHVTTYTYDGAGRRLSEELAGERTEYVYDALGRLYCTKRGDSCHITEYDDLDRIIEERDEDTQQNLYKKVCYKYDDAGNLSQTTRWINGKEAQETFIYDSCNRLIEHKDALGHITTTTYDDHYRNSQGQTVLQKTETDPLGLQTITVYDVLDHEVSVEKKNYNNKVLDIEEYFYDENGNLALHIKNHNHTVSWEYDPMNRIEILTVGGDRSTHYAYTKTGLVRSKRKPDGVI